jgi:ketopantoate reductase
MNRDSILILGTGALATLFAARLAAAGVSITMLGTWPEGLAALRENGVPMIGCFMFTQQMIRPNAKASDLRWYW